MRAVTSRGLDEEPVTSPTAASSTTGVARTSGSSPTPTLPTFEAQRFTALGLVVRIGEQESNRVEAEPETKSPETLSALFVGRLFGGPGSLKRITPYQRMDGIDCSPDGTRILSSSPYPLGRTRKSENVFSVRTDGSGLVQLTRSHGGSVHNPHSRGRRTGRRSPSSATGTDSQLYVMNADGTAVTQVTHGPEVT